MRPACQVTGEDAEKNEKTDTATESIVNTIDDRTGR